MIAWYRKYRPQSVGELDQKKVREFFERVLQSGKVSQAYLFSGPKGTGKTSAARILAKAVNCERNQRSKIKDQNGQSKVKTDETQKLNEPCGKCDSCKAIEAGRSTAVVEIDAASNRGIDDVREMRARLGLVAGDGAFSVYIIDEVHMLTKEAFNALLKTLEEPPEHVIFCLCTTEENKLPGTVVSRCTRVVYSKASGEEVVRSLGRVVKGEGLEVGEDVLEAIAGRSDGSFRDAVKVLEQLAGAGKEITLRMVEDEIGGGVEKTDKLLKLVLAGEAKEALEVVAEIEEAGGDMKLAVKELVEKAAERVRQGVIEEGRADGRLMELIEVFSKAFVRFREVPVAALPLEMAVVEFCLKVGSLNSGGGGGGGEEKATEPRAESQELQAKSEKLKTKNNNLKGISVQTEEAGSEADKQREEKNVGVKNGLVKGTLKFAEVNGRWGEVLAEISKKNHGLVTLLKGARPVGCEGAKLRMAVGYKFHKEQLEQERYLRVIEEVMGGVFGMKVRMVVEVGNGDEIPMNMSEHENISGAIEEADEKLAAMAEDVFGG